jgi:hypothetical protein
MRDDVGVNVVGQVEADGATARAAALRVVVADGRNPGEIRKTHRHRDRAPLKVRRPRQRCALGRRCKCAAEQEAFRMGGPQASLDAAVCFVEGGDHIAAKSHHLFIGTQGHCSLLHRVRQAVRGCSADKIKAAHRYSQRLLAAVCPGALSRRSTLNLDRGRIERSPAAMLRRCRCLHPGSRNRFSGRELNTRVMAPGS